MCNVNTIKTRARAYEILLLELARRDSEMINSLLKEYTDEQNAQLLDNAHDAVEDAFINSIVYVYLYKCDDDELERAALYYAYLALVEALKDRAYLDFYDTISYDSLVKLMRDIEEECERVVFEHVQKALEYL